MSSLKSTEVNILAKTFLQKNFLLNSGMNLLMLSKRWTVAEDLSTFTPFKGFLSSVSSHVLRQSCHKRPFHILCTHRFFSSVDPIMPNKICRLGKGLSTFSAYIGLLSSVNPHVSSKGRAIIKDFCTYFTFQGLFSTVDHIMSDKNRVVCKGLSTFPAHS